MEYSDNTGPNGQHYGPRAYVSRAEEKVRELRQTATTEAAHRVHDIGGRAQQRLDAERDRVASRIEDAALRLRQRSDAAGPVGQTAGQQVAVRMEAAAGYLHEHPAEEIAGDLATYVKHHPMKAVIAAAVVGYLFGRMAA